MNGKELRWYDAKTLQQEGLIVLENQFGANEVIFGPDPNLVAVVGYPLLVINLHQKTVTPVRFDQDLDGFDTSFEGVQFSPDARLLFFHRISLYGTGGNESIDAWDIQHQQQLDSYWYWNPDEIGESLTDPVISPNKNWIAAGYGKLLQIRDIKTGKIVRSIQGHDSNIADVTFSKDGSRFASIDTQHVLYLWDSQTGKNLGRFSFNAETLISKLSFLDNNQQVVVTFWGGDGQVIDLQTNQVLAVPAPAPVIDPFAMLLHHQGYSQFSRGFGTPVLSISPDGKTLAVGSETVLLWDIQTQKLLDVLELPDKRSDSLMEIKFDPTGHILAGNLPYKTVVWNLTTTTQPNLPKVLGSASRDFHEDLLVFSPDGKRIAFKPANSFIEIWDVETAQQIKTLQIDDESEKSWIDVQNSETEMLGKIDTGSYRSAIFSKSKDLLFTNDDVNTLRGKFYIWQVNTGKLVYSSESTNVDGSFYDIDLLQASNFVATSYQDGTIQLFDISAIIDEARQP